MPDATRKNITIRFEQYSTPVSPILDYLYNTYCPKAIKNNEERKQLAEKLEIIQSDFAALEKALSDSVSAADAQPVSQTLFNPLLFVKEVVSNKEKNEITVYFADGSSSTARGPQNQPFSLSTGFAVALLKNMLTTDTLTDDLVREKVNVIENYKEE